MRVVIVDDEKGSIEILEQKISEFVKGATVVATFYDPSIALDYLQKGDLDVLFLDVDMPGMNGFELIRKIPDLKFEIVFTTAYSQFAIDAIRIGAFDYLTKPILIDDLIKCFNRLSHFISPIDQIRDFSFKKLQDQHEKLLVSTNEAYEYIQIEKIIYFKAEGNYTSIVLLDQGPILVSKPLGEYEENLNLYGFIRSHHSFLVNIQHIKKFVKEDGGYLITTDNHILSVSKRKKEELIKILKTNSL